MSEATLLVPVLPLREVCLFPEASLSFTTTILPAAKAVEMGRRTDRQVLALAQRDPSPTAWRELYMVGTMAEITDDMPLADGSHRIELDGLRRARVLTLLTSDVMVAEAELLPEGDANDYWGAAVEALARYLHSHQELRGFLQQRRSSDAMSWVNLACQHLPITASARQKLLEADAPERCLKISRGLDALLRKEQVG